MGRLISCVDRLNYKIPSVFYCPCFKLFAGLIDILFWAILANDSTKIIPGRFTLSTLRKHAGKQARYQGFVLMPLYVSWKFFLRTDCFEHIKILTGRGCVVYSGYAWNDKNPFRTYVVIWLIQSSMIKYSPKYIVMKTSDFSITIMYIPLFSRGMRKAKSCVQEWCIGNVNNRNQKRYVDGCKLGLIGKYTGKQDLKMQTN